MTEIMTEIMTEFFPKEHTPSLLNLPDIAAKIG